MYNKKELETEALDAIKRYNLFFTEDVVVYMSCARSTFYNHELDKLDSIKEALSKNKVITKSGLRKKWYEKGNATTEIALYKLLGSEEEVHRLNGSKQEIKHTGAVPTHRISDEAREKIKDILEDEY